MFKKLFKVVSAFLHRNPTVKTVAIGVGSAAVTAAAAGEFGKEAAVVAGTLVSMGVLHVKRPADATPSDKAGIVVGDIVRRSTSEPGKGLMTVERVLETAVGGRVQLTALCIWFEESELKSGTFRIDELVEEVK